MDFGKEEKTNVCIHFISSSNPSCPAFHLKSYELPIHYNQCSCWIWMIAQLLLLPEIQNIRGVIHLMPWQLWRQGWRMTTTQNPKRSNGVVSSSTTGATDVGMVIKTHLSQALLHSQRMACLGTAAEAALPVFFVHTTGVKRNNGAKLYFQPGKAPPHRPPLSLV